MQIIFEFLTSPSTKGGALGFFSLDQFNNFLQETEGNNLINNENNPDAAEEMFEFLSKNNTMLAVLFKLIENAINKMSANSHDKLNLKNITQPGYYQTSLDCSFEKLTEELRKEPSEQSILKIEEITKHLKNIIDIFYSKKFNSCLDAKYSAQLQRKIDEISKLYESNNHLDKSSNLSDKSSNLSFLFKLARARFGADKTKANKLWVLYKICNYVEGIRNYISTYKVTPGVARDMLNLADTLSKVQEGEYFDVLQTLVSFEANNSLNEYEKNICNDIKQYMLNHLNNQLLKKEYGLIANSFANVPSNNLQNIKILDTSTYKGINLFQALFLKKFSETQDIETNLKERFKKESLECQNKVFVDSSYPVLDELKTSNHVADFLNKLKEKLLVNDDRAQEYKNLKNHILERFKLRLIGQVTEKTLPVTDMQKKNIVINLIYDYFLNLIFSANDMPDEIIKNIEKLNNDIKDAIKHQKVQQYFNAQPPALQDVLKMCVTVDQCSDEQLITNIFNQVNKIEFCLLKEALINKFAVKVFSCDMNADFAQNLNNLLMKYTDIFFNSKNTGIETFLCATKFNYDQFLLIKTLYPGNDHNIFKKNLCMAAKEQLGASKLECASLKLKKSIETDHYNIIVPWRNDEGGLIKNIEQQNKTEYLNYNNRLKDSYVNSVKQLIRKKVSKALGIRSGEDGGIVTSIVEGLYNNNSIPNDLNQPISEQARKDLLNLTFDESDLLEIRGAIDSQLIPQSLMNPLTMKHVKQSWHSFNKNSRNIKEIKKLIEAIKTSQPQENIVLNTQQEDNGTAQNTEQEVAIDFSETIIFQDNLPNIISELCNNIN